MIVEVVEEIFARNVDIKIMKKNTNYAYIVGD